MTTNTTVKINTGELLGSYENAIYVFRGVPYAAPPIGNFRWMPPQPPEAWIGVRPALQAGSIAPQNGSNFKRTTQFVITEPQSEDCLFLNIWSPGLDNRKRPVMVWFHGGAFTLGSGSQIDFNGTALAKLGNVVVVTINYRLGLLGFLNLNEVTHHQIPSSGNEALLDQAAALEWIKKNIAVFGGDSGNVTLFGESAGAMCMACLMAMPKAKGLFHKIIFQSGAFNKIRPLNEAVQHARLFFNCLGNDMPDPHALRSLTVQQLLSLQQTIESKIPAMTIASPVLDGDILPSIPLDAVRSGYASNIPMIFGTNLDEWRLFNPNTPNFQKIDYTDLVKRLAELVPDSKIDSLIESYRKAKDKQNLPSAPADLFIAIKSDYEFRIPGIRLTEAQLQYNPAVYNYTYEWKSTTEMFGSCHSLEIGSVFGTYNNNPEFYGSGPSAEKVSQSIREAWAAFAWTGNPSCSSLGNWPYYGSERRTQMLGLNPRVENAPFDEERKSWDSIFP